MNASAYKIKALLDVNINGNVSKDNLSSGSIIIKAFYDLNIDRREDDDRIARIASENGIFIMITQDAFFGNKTGQQWKKIPNFCLLIPSNDIVKCFRDDQPNKQLLKQIKEKILEVDQLRTEHKFFNIGINMSAPNRVEITT